MKNKRALTMLLAVTMIATLFVTPAFAASNANQDTLHEVAEILRNQLGYPSDHASVRVLSDMWARESGTNLGNSYYYSSRTNRYYYFNKSNTDGTFSGSYNSSNRRQAAAATAVNMLVATYGKNHPTVAAVSDILAAECGVSASLSYYYSNLAGKYLYFSGSYDLGNTSSNGTDNGQTNNTEKVPGGATTNNTGTTNSTPSSGTNNSNTNANNATTSSEYLYALYSAQDYYAGAFTGTDKYVDADKALVVARFINSYGYNESSWTKQAALGWTVINYLTGRTYDAATVKAAYPDYNPNASTTNAHGDDVLALAKDLLFRLNAEKAGITNVGRVLPKDYGRLWIMDDGTIYFRNQGGENAPNWDFSLKSPYRS